MTIADRFVASPPSEHGPRNASVMGITIHMAEGGGTVSWLTRADGNSSHYVVEYSGRITQMVVEDHWAGSINPNLIRKDNDAPYTFLGERITYGRAAALSALGLTAANNPNRYVIAIEVEGFAADGPNEKQNASLLRLVKDIRSRHGNLPCLGHRDFQNYKRCPGHKVRWADYGGHAVGSIKTVGQPDAQGESMKLTTVVPVAGTVTMDEAGPVWNVATGARVNAQQGTTWVAVSTCQFDSPGDADGSLVNGYSFAANAPDKELHVVAKSRVTFKSSPSASELELAAAHAAGVSAEQTRLKGVLGLT